MPDSPRRRIVVTDCQAMSLGDTRPFRGGCAPAPSPSAAEKDRAQIRVTCVTVPWPPSSASGSVMRVGEALFRSAAVQWHDWQGRRFGSEPILGGAGRTLAREPPW